MKIRLEKCHAKFRDGFSVKILVGTLLDACTRAGDRFRCGAYRPCVRGEVAMPRICALAILCWISSFLPSSAGPREDSLAGIARCKPISDDRKFLDCLYGAAQPLRAELGLIPAPAFQTSLVPPDPAVLALPAGEIGKALAARTAGKVLVASGNLRIASYAFDPRGHFTVTLTDGSVWRQLDRDESFADWRGPATSYYVSLKSSGNDYYLDVKGGTGPYQVERLR